MFRKYDFDEDTRYTRAEDRPPWELSPGGQLKELFSSRKVDELTHDACDDLEKQKKAHEQAHARRAAAQQRMQQQRERAQQQLRERTRSIVDDPESRAPEQDPRGKRYTYPNDPQPRPAAQASVPLRNRAQGGKNRTALIVALVFAVIGVLGGIFEAVDEAMDEPEITVSPFREEEEFPDRDFGFDVPDEFFNWEDEDEESEEDAVSYVTKNELTRAELNPDLDVEIRSAVGKEPLSYQALYAKCAPSTVSITVVTPTGVGSGTGIVMTSDGYILTCDHVIAGSITCQITTYDDRIFPALLVGSDAQTDLAVLKVEAQDLVPAEFGSSDELTVGDEALAIGDPLGSELRGTLTNGIISAINRNVTVNNYSMTLIQTTAALNSGNSGGPLINIYGQVVGVNNMKMNSGAVTVEGLGFAVPTGVVKEIVPILASEGTIRRPVLGITCYGIDESYMELYGEPTTGLRVATINENSDALVQGLQIDDYITHVNDIPVVCVEDVKAILDHLNIGDTIDLTVQRYDEESGELLEELIITITLMDQNDLA